MAGFVEASGVTLRRLLDPDPVAEVGTTAGFALLAVPAPDVLDVIAGGVVAVRERLVGNAAIAEADVNQVLATGDDALALDALVLLSGDERGSEGADGVDGEGA